MPYTRPDGSHDEPVETLMVDIAPHVAVSADYARVNGMSTLVPKREGKVPAKLKKTDTPQ